MTLSAENARNTRLTLRYPPDKLMPPVVGSFTVANNAEAVHTIPHTYGKKLFPELVWSLNNTTFQSGRVIPTTSDTYPYVKCTVSVSATQILLYAWNEGTGSTQTIYYKVHLLWP